ncbi:MAG: hypothetical protein ACLPX9_04200, partial [Rhodomicrobium sp.]
RMALIPFRVQIVAKRPDRSRINVMRSVHKIKPDSRGLDPAIHAARNGARFQSFAGWPGQARP